MSEIWSVKSVQMVQGEVKEAVARELDRGGAEAATQFIRSEISRLNHAVETEAPLRRLIYCISALYNHRRHDTLKSSEVRALYDLAIAILRASNVKPARSRVAFLYGDLHQVMTQIMLVDGRYWESALELARIYRFGDLSATDSDHQRNFAMGIRLERLGMLQEALVMYEGISPEGLLPLNRLNLIVRRMRLLRLLGHNHRHQEMLASLANSEDASLQRELTFEKTISECLKNQEFRPLFNQIRKGGELYQMSYVLECRFWLVSTKTREFIKDLPNMIQLSRRNDLCEQMDDPLAPISRLLDKVIDDDFSNDGRVDSLVEVAAQATKLPTFENELLAMVAVARAASRRNIHELSDIVVKRYRFLCLSASGGKSADLIGLIPDLVKPSGSKADA